MNVWMYHKELGAKLFEKESDAGDGWFDTPAAFESESTEKAEAVEPEAPRRGRPKKAEAVE